MKVEDRVLDVDSTLTGEKVKMGIDADATAHIMSILTDLYSDPELAVIREYSTNALDAHVQAGVKRPIEVTLPSPLSPFFKVRDYGVGLDIEDIRSIYSQYGASTKRNSNEVVGMLGLGCKSALTYSDQFTLTGYKDGVATQVSISRDEDGGGSMTIVNEYETDEQGVEIIVPAKSGHGFTHKAADFFQYWEKGTILVNDAEPKRIDGLWIADDILLTQDADDDMVVMGNVAYPVPDSPYGNYHTICFVNIGDVNFTPSRESLMMTTKTKATLARLHDRIKQEKQAALERLIDEADNKWDAIAVAAQARNMGLDVRNMKPKYKGVEIPSTFEADRKQYHQFVVVQAVKHSYQRSKGWGKDYSRSTQLQNTIWFYGYTSDAFTPYKRQKLEQWVEKQGLTKPEHYVLTAVMPEHSEWIDPTKVFSWDGPESEKIVREKRERGDGRITGSYDGWIDGKWEDQILATDIQASGKKVFWCRKNEHRTNYWDRSTPNSYKALIELEPDCIVVSLGENRIAKFERDFPNTMHTDAAVAERANAWYKGISQHDISVLLMENNDSRNILMSMDAEHVADPYLAEAVRCAQEKADAKLRAKWGLLRRYITEKIPANDKYLSNYPLLTTCSYYGSLREIKSDLHIYVNAKYASDVLAQQKGA